MVWVLLCALWLQAPETAPAQAVTQGLRIIVLDCDGAINDIRSGTACEPRVRVEDENGKAAVGAKVSFTLPENGPGGIFPQNQKTLAVLTDSNGEAVASGLRANGIGGSFRIRIVASLEGSTAETSILEINASRISPTVEKRSAGKRKMLAILGGAAAAIAVVVLRGGGDRAGQTTTPGTTIVPGKPSVGPP